MLVQFGNNCTHNRRNLHSLIARAIIPKLHSNPCDYLYISTHTHTHTHTNTVPSRLHAFGGRSAGHPDGEEGDEVPDQVRQRVCCVCHDGQTASQIAPCEKENIHNGRREERGGGGGGVRQTDELKGMNG